MGRFELVDGRIMLSPEKAESFLRAKGLRMRVSPGPRVERGRRTWSRRRRQVCSSSSTFSELDVDEGWRECRRPRRALVAELRWARASSSSSSEREGSETAGEEAKKA